MDDGTIAFVLRALALKDEPRRGWLRAGIVRPESVADHTWGVALLATIVAPTRADVDAGRALELAVLHDTCEAAVGDLVPGEYASREEKLDRERAGLVAMLDGAPDAIRTRMLGAFDELAQDETPEAKLVHELDKLEMAFQAARYETAGTPRHALTDYRASSRRAIHAPDLKRALDTLGA